MFYILTNAFIFLSTDELLKAANSTAVFRELSIKARRFRFKSAEKISEAGSKNLVVVRDPFNDVLLSLSRRQTIENWAFPCWIFDLHYEVIHIEDSSAWIRELLPGILSKKHPIMQKNTVQ